MALLSVSEVLRIAKADCKSSICCFWHGQPSDPPDHPLITGYNRDSTSLVSILSHWHVLQGGLGRGGIQSTSTGHWGSSGISSWTPPLLQTMFDLAEPSVQLRDGYVPTKRTSTIHESFLSMLNAQTLEAAIVTVPRHQETTTTRNAQVIRHL